MPADADCLPTLPQEDEKQRSVAALSRAEDLQGELDRLAVEQTLRGVSGGVSASSLIDHFAGKMLKHSRRVEVRAGCLEGSRLYSGPSTRRNRRCCGFVGRSLK